MPMTGYTHGIKSAGVQTLVCKYFRVFLFPGSSLGTRVIVEAPASTS